MNEPFDHTHEVIEGDLHAWRATTARDLPALAAPVQGLCARDRGLARVASWRWGWAAAAVAAALAFVPVSHPRLVGQEVTFKFPAPLGAAARAEVGRGLQAGLGAEVVRLERLGEGTVFHARVRHRSARETRSRAEAFAALLQARGLPAEVALAPWSTPASGNVYALASNRIQCLLVDVGARSAAEIEAEIRGRLQEIGFSETQISVQREGGNTSLDLRGTDPDGRVHETALRLETRGDPGTTPPLAIDLDAFAALDSLPLEQRRAAIERRLHEQGLEGRVTLEDGQFRVEAEAKKTLPGPIASAQVVTDQPSATNPRQKHSAALEGLVQSSGDAALETFIDTQVSPRWLESMPRAELLSRLRDIRTACADFGGVLLKPVGADGTRITFLQGPRQTSVWFRLEAEPPHKIVALELEPTVDSPQVKASIPPLGWDTLEKRLQEEAAAGFSGSVLVVRDGKIVLQQGYGWADRERGRPITTETIFAIGSVPIDFTRAAILRLEEQGNLALEDPITKYLQDVPEDKRSMTLQHLMSGKSGLPDFHGILGVDEDLDLSWIERETAIRRILSQELLFPPGSGEAHSHSAWVLLAAIVELVSQESYGNFLTRHFFEPAGMTRTGLHEDAARFGDDQFAVGYGFKTVGKINTPRYWGRTSWLVMGSGGMQSTPVDLYKWIEAIRGGKILSPAAAGKYWTQGVLAGGDERGFLCMYTEGPNTLFILCSNAHSQPGDRVSMLGRRLAQLVRDQPQKP